MYDQQIRQAFHKKYLGHYHSCADVVVLDEFGIRHGASRADIAVINGTIEGFEIKSEFDSLARLPEQVSAYNAIFEKASLITCEKHLEQALGIIPRWWGVYSVKAGKRGAVLFSCMRKSKKNVNIDLYTLVQLLWRDEALAMAGKFLAIPASSKLARHDLYELLSLQVPKNVLFPEVLNMLKARSGWRKDHSQL